MDLHTNTTTKKQAKQKDRRLLSAALLVLWMCIRMLLATLVAYSLLSFVGCSKKNRVEVRSIPSKLIVSSLKSDSTANETINNPLMKASTSNTTWAHVDGIKLSLIEIAAIGKNMHSTILDYSSSGGQIIELSGDHYNSKFDQNGPIKEGTYDRMRVEFSNEYSIKAYGYTATKTCYTTVAAIVCKEGLVAVSDFSNYDYYKYEFAYVTTAIAPHNTNDKISETTSLPSPITVNSQTTSLTFQINIDIYRLVTLWDGTNSRPSVAPFYWSNNNEQSISAFFPDMTPAFGMSYMPTYISVNDPGITTGQVYLIGKDEQRVESHDPESFNLQDIQYLVLVFKSTGEYVGGRVVNFCFDLLNQFISGFVPDENDTYNFYNGEWWQPDSRYLQDRLIVGFRKTALNETYAASFENGPDCDLDLIDPAHADWGIRTRKCLPTDENIYFKRVR